MNLILKFIYNPLINQILRKFFFLISKISGKQIISISGKLNLEYKGTQFHLHTNQTCYVTKVLYYEGVDNYEFTPVMTSLIKKSNIFFDIGANIGYFSVLGAKLNPEIQIYSFEPSKGPLHYLKKNIVSNQLKNVKVIGKAVADVDGELEFHDVINTKYPWLKYFLNGSNSLQNKYGKKRAESYKVPTTTLANVIKEHNINQVDLIKLDTEFTEHIILDNSIDVVKEFRPLIIAEIYAEIEEQTQSILKQVDNYYYFHIDENNKVIEIKRLSEIASSEERNFIFCPKEKKSFLNEFIAH